MNVTMLTKVAQSSKAADVVFKYLAGRERAAWTLNLSRMYTDVTADGSNLSRETFNKVFEDLQKAGAGTIVHGRRGNPNRFVWNYNFREAATQTLSSIKAIKKPEVVSKSDTAAKGSTIIQMTLPPGMSLKDIQALIELAKGASPKAGV